MEEFVFMYMILSFFFMMDNPDNYSSEEEGMLHSIMNAGMLSLLEEEYFKNFNEYEHGEFVYSRNRHIFFRSLSNVYRRIRSQHIPRCALLLPSMSPWTCLYGSNNEQALINTTGFSFSGFHQILEHFTPLYNDF